jgi:hypothetical protein
MPAKKTIKKRATKKVAASAAGAIVPLQPKTITEVIDFLKDNKDFAVGLHSYFEQQRDGLLQAAWGQGSENYDMKASAAAMYITDEILSLGLNS